MNDQSGCASRAAGFCPLAGPRGSSSTSAVSRAYNRSENWSASRDRSDEGRLGFEYKARTSKTRGCRRCRRAKGRLATVVRASGAIFSVFLIFMGRCGSGCRDTYRSSCTCRLRSCSGVCVLSTESSGGFDRLFDSPVSRVFLSFFGCSFTCRANRCFSSCFSSGGPPGRCGTISGGNGRNRRSLSADPPSFTSRT